MKIYFYKYLTESLQICYNNYVTFFRDSQRTERKQSGEKPLYRISEAESKPKGGKNTKLLGDEKFDIAQSEIDSLARFLQPQIQKFFESEEGRKKFEEWKKKREMK